jgi:hypothetical protein
MLLGLDANDDHRNIKVSNDFEQVIIMIKALKESNKSLDLGQIKTKFSDWLKKNQEFLS